jgi:hypothetical protein
MVGMSAMIFTARGNIKQPLFNIPEDENGTDPTEKDVMEMGPMGMNKC